VDWHSASPTVASDCWVFTPQSFAGLCEEIAELDSLDFVCEHRFDTVEDGIEFHVGLAVNGSKDERVASWRRMRAEAA